MLKNPAFFLPFKIFPFFIFIVLGCVEGTKIDYLGQEPPGLEPKVFAPGIVSTPNHKEFGCTFSPDMKEFFFTRDGHILVCRFDGETWGKPVPASFNTDHMDHEPHITADGKRLFFGSARKEYGIWMTEKTAGKWGEPSFVGSGMYVTSSRNGDIFLTSFDKKDGSLARTKVVNGKFEEFLYLEGGVDSPFNDWHPCIAPDGSYILFDSNRPGSHQGEGAYDLYICFKEKDGSWGKAINIGEKLNISAGAICAYISPDGKYLFYNSGKGEDWDIYWVETTILQNLKPL